MEPRLVMGAETPMPRKDRKDSVKMAEGICRKVVVTIWPMQLGSRCRRMIRPPLAPRARAAVTYSCCLSWGIWPRMMRLMVTQYSRPKAMKMEMRLGPRMVTRFWSGPLPEFWKFSRMGLRVAERSRMMSTSGMV